MSFQLPRQPAETFERRRRALAQRLAGRAGLFFSGTPRARNYPGNPYPFRADSHFLYLGGAQIPNAALLVQPQATTLFFDPPGADEQLWDGPSPAPEQIASALGVKLRPMAQLQQAVTEAGGTTGVGTLPSADPLTRHRQTVLLARGWPPDRHPDVEELEGPDAAVAEAMIELRLRHDAAALEGIRAAVEGTVAAHCAGMAATRPGLAERDIRAAMERELLARDMGCAYGSIVTVAGEVLHNNTYHRPLQAGDLVLADVGGEHDGWASDVTRTWPVSGRFSTTQRALYDIVLQAQGDAIELVKPGVRYRDVHLAACVTLARGLVDQGLLRGDPEGLVERGAHALFFPHGVGHLLGLDVHDMEDLGDRAGYAAGRQRSQQFGLAYLRLDRDLEPGMAVTVEPGLYFVPAILQNDELVGPFVADGTLHRDALERFSDVRGIRIEDDVLCTDTGHEVLTAAVPKTADAVQAQVGHRGP